MTNWEQFLKEWEAGEIEDTLTADEHRRFDEMAAEDDALHRELRSFEDACNLYSPPPG